MKKISLIVILAMLSGCSTVDIKSKPVVFTPVTVPDPAPMNLSHVTWKVYNANDIKILAKSLNGESSRTFVLYGLDNDNFQLMDANLQDMFRYILEENKTKDFYKNLELNENTAIDSSKKTK